MSELKRKQIIQKLENHLRSTSRQLIKIDTEEEAIQFLINSFQMKLYCDFVGIVLVESGEFVPRALAGDSEKIKQKFPLKAANCSPLVLSQSLRDEDADRLGECALTEVLEKSDFNTWFTVPLIDDGHQYGFCVVGFYEHIPLLEMYETFDEFGKDVAAAIALARRKDQQLRKIEGIEWISRNLSINKSLEKSISEFTLRAAKGTDAESACIYLFNENESCFQLQYPTYGSMDYTEKIDVIEINALKAYFPFLEQTGNQQLTIPIILNLKTIGVLHVENNENDQVFTKDDRHLLRLLTDHIAILLENAQLYNTEKDQRQRLQIMLDYQQALVKETVFHDDFHGVTEMLGGLYKGSVILLDRFLRPLSSKMQECEQGLLDTIVAEAEMVRSTTEVFKVMAEEEGYHFMVWPIHGVNSLLGYLAVGIREDEMDEFDQLTIELARNICSIQFIKQKLVLDANEQAKDTFMRKLLVENIEDEKSILQYANLFQWEIYHPHRVANLSIELADSEMDGLNLLEQTMKKSIVWDYIIDRIKPKYRHVLTATYNEQYLLIIPIMEEKGYKRFWNDFYKNIKEAASKSAIKCDVLLGVGSKVTDIHQYYMSYEQSVQVVNVVENRYKTKGYAIYEELGSYTILHHLEHPVVDMFMDSQLGSLLAYSKKSNVDLFDTLKAYLQNNGNAKSTSEQLFIHRSSLLYRLERVEELLGVDLNDSEVRFDLMMALKLYDMTRQSD